VNSPGGERLTAILNEWVSLTPPSSKIRSILVSRACGRYPLCDACAKEIRSARLDSVCRASARRSMTTGSVKRVLSTRLRTHGKAVAGVKTATTTHLLDRCCASAATSRMTLLIPWLHCRQTRTCSAKSAHQIASIASTQAMQANRSSGKATHRPRRLQKQIGSTHCPESSSSAQWTKTHVLLRHHPRTTAAPH
jgi:hypothetical protein